MTSRRQFEKDVWSFLYGYIVAASTADELGIEGYDDLSEADRARAHAAIERVAAAVGRHL